ncbi:MAG: hypothetical protein WKG07_23605 [Hymenobacter sp.]
MVLLAGGYLGWTALPVWQSPRKHRRRPGRRRRVPDATPRGRARCSK